MLKFTRKASGHFVTLIEMVMCLITCISGHNCVMATIRTYNEQKCTEKRIGKFPRADFVQARG